jgi:UDPglucose 6-dehydrogenase
VRIGIVGTGWVGLVTGAGLADFGNEVVCADVNEKKIVALEKGEIPFYEPGLKELAGRNVRQGRLRFTTSVEDTTRWAQVLFICVGTPQDADGSANLEQVDDAARMIAGALSGYRLIVQKSTVPVGTGDRIRALMKKHARRGASFDVASNPEFLREGTAVENFMHPDRVIVGADSARARKLLREVYAPLFLIETPIVVTNVRTAELIKYASNAFLAMKISFINEMANLSEVVGADVHGVAKGIGLDRRIGPKFLHAGPGYGGSCFPKDTVALCHFSSRAGVPMRLVDATVRVNEAQKARAARKILAALKGRGTRTVAILGLAFKPDTNDMRAAPSLDIIRILRRRGVRVRVFDPVVREGTPGAPRGVFYAADAYDAVRGADAVAVVTEWNQFRRLNLGRVRRLMRRRAIVDLRNVYDPQAVRRLGFDYTSVGRL